MRYVNLKLICINETVAPVCGLCVYGVRFCFICGRCIVCFACWDSPPQFLGLERAAQLLDGVGQVQDLGVHLVDQSLQLVHGIEDFDALGVRVEAHLEGRDMVLTQRRNLSLASSKLSAT